jgi:hypothetical protein
MSALREGRAMLEESLKSAGPEEQETLREAIESMKVIERAVEGATAQLPVPLRSLSSSPRAALRDFVGQAVLVALNQVLAGMTVEAALHPRALAQVKEH